MLWGCIRITSGFYEVVGSGVPSESPLGPLKQGRDGGLVARLRAQEADDGRGGSP